MAHNPYDSDLDDTFRNEKVEVQTGDGATYTGWVKRWRFNTESILLYDATRNGTEDVGATTISNPVQVSRVDGEPTIEEVSPSEISPSPYHSRDFETGDIAEFARATRERGHLPSYPCVRKLADGRYEVLEGHRRLAVARRAQFDTVPVRVEACTDWEAAVRFVDDHIPLPEDNWSNNSTGEWYSDDEMVAAIRKLRNRWDDDRLRELYALEYHIDRLADEGRLDVPEVTRNPGTELLPIDVVDVGVRTPRDV